MQSTFDSLYKSDEDAATNGIPIIIGKNSSGGQVTLWIAENLNPKHKKAMRKRSKKMESNRTSDEREKLVCEIYAEGILITWEGVIDSNGDVIEPTFENKVAMLKKYDRLFNDIAAISENHNNYLSEGEDPDAGEETEGNLEAS